MPNQFGFRSLISFWARVEDIDDPLKQGRVRIRCFGIHEDNPAKLPTNVLPWATVLQPTTSAGIHGIGVSGNGLLVGSIVYGQFLDGEDAQVPLITGTLGMTMNTEYDPNNTATTSSLPTYLSSQSAQAVSPTSAYGTAMSSANPASIPAPTGAILADVFTLGNLTAVQVQNFKNLIGYRESTNNYTSVNQLGYLGKYQFGASALQTVGFVNNGATNATLTNPSVWTGKMDVHSKADYLGNGSAQEVAMDGLMSVNYKSLVRNGIVSISSPADVVTGYLAIAHLLGTGGCIQFKQGINGSDANGTTASKYYILGTTACK